MSGYQRVSEWLWRALLSLNRAWRLFQASKEDLSQWEGLGPDFKFEAQESYVCFSAR